MCQPLWWPNNKDLESAAKLLNENLEEYTHVSVTKSHIEKHIEGGQNFTATT